MAMRLVGRERRKLRIRKRISGTSTQPRMSVFRTAKHIYAQVIDDSTGRTLAHASTLSKDLASSLDDGTKTDAAKKVGALIARICLARNIDRVVFDRNGYLYHGRVSALADAARAQYAAAEAAYRGKVRNAVREVEEAMVRLASVAERMKDTLAAAAGYRESLEGARTRQRAGLASLIELEEARRLDIGARSAVTALAHERVQAWIALYRAVGGGWSAP